MGTTNNQGIARLTLTEHYANIADGHEYKENKRLQELSSRLRQLKSMLHAEKCRISHEFFNKEIRRSHKRCAKFLQKEIDKLTEVIALEISKQERLCNKQRILETFKGVGKATSQTLLLDVPELGYLSREAIGKSDGP